MLVVQAVLAYGHFFGKEYNSALADRIYSELFSEKQNIVLIGMPGCGKTTIGKLIAQSCGKTFVDTDSMITGKTGMTVNDIFKKYGENEFRKLESEAVREASEKVGQVIATGGGAVLRSENAVSYTHLETGICCGKGRSYFRIRILHTSAKQRRKYDGCKNTVY